MLSADIAIRAVGLGKTYRLYDHPFQRVRQMLSLGGKKHYREFEALKDVSFEIKKGETVGIIGRNGSGKSTLLQLICGILKPSHGSVEVNGRVSALLELGAGFHPEFTGRENVYMQGAIMGLTREEMDARFDDIAAFADVGDFIEQPVKTYSSGMFVRLAFAVAVSVEPDILVVDEALAVGDAGFQAKCFARIQAMKDRGTTIILVTHAAQLVIRHCDRAVLLQHGEVLSVGESRKTTNLYLSMESGNGTSSRPTDGANLLEQRPFYCATEQRWGDGRAKITDCHIESDNIPIPGIVTSNSLLRVTIAVEFQEAISRPVFGLLIRTTDGIYVYGTNSLPDSSAVEQVDAAIGELWECTFTFQCRLNSGDYLLSLGISQEEEDHVLAPLDRRYDSVLMTVSTAKPFLGLVDLESGFSIAKP